MLIIKLSGGAADEGGVLAMQTKLRNILENLDEVLRTILKEDNQNQNETLLLLQWVLFSGVPLRPEELYLLLRQVWTHPALTNRGITNT